MLRARSAASAGGGVRVGGVHGAPRPLLRRRSPSTGSANRGGGRQPNPGAPSSAAGRQTAIAVLTFAAFQRWVLVKGHEVLRRGRRSLSDATVGRAGPAEPVRVPGARGGRRPERERLPCRAAVRARDVLPRRFRSPAPRGRLRCGSACHRPPWSPRGGRGRVRGGWRSTCESAGGRAAGSGAGPFG